MILSMVDCFLILCLLSIITPGNIVLERPKRALLSVRRQAMRTLLSMSLILHFVSSISRIVLFQINMPLNMLKQTI